MTFSEPLSQYEEILKDAIRTSMKESGAKLAKTFQTLLVEILTLRDNDVVILKFLHFSYEGITGENMVDLAECRTFANETIGKKINEENIISRVRDNNSGAECVGAD